MHAAGLTPRTVRAAESPRLLAAARPARHWETNEVMLWPGRDAVNEPPEVLIIPKVIRSLAARGAVWLIVRPYCDHTVRLDLPLL